MNKLHPGIKWYFRIQSYSVLTILFFASYLSLIFLLFSVNSFTTSINAFSTGNYEPVSAPEFQIPLLIIFVSILVIIIISEVYARLVYNNWAYEFTPEEIKVESGVIFKHYRSVPYGRVQNVDITRGVLSRLLGYSTLNIHTAGYSIVHQKGLFTGSKGHNPSEAHIPAVSSEKAEKIRKRIIGRIANKEPGV